jgi:hypothetical protein
MKSADCPLGAAAGMRARIPLPQPAFAADVQRMLKLLAIGAGFVCGCWLGAAWTSDDAMREVVPIVGKWASLVAGPFVLGHRPVRLRYEVSGGRT